MGEPFVQDPCRYPLFAWIPCPTRGPPRKPCPTTPGYAHIHAGESSCLEQSYRDQFDAVYRTVGQILSGADGETVVHEVFFRLLNDASLRRAFGGGSFPAWLRTVARNQAIDHARRRKLEVAFVAESLEGSQPSVDDRLEQRIDARRILERFESEVLPPKWRRVFVARFVQQQDQPTAARSLEMRRTTLAYQEYRIRGLLRRFVLRGEGEK
jgi:RNA polymerase sigma-70 factor (ECF subfamily)